MMVKDGESDATRLLERMRYGDDAAAEELLPIVWGELHARASSALRSQAGATLQTTDLIHEAWLKLVGGDGTEWRSRDHFFGVAARAMRSVLVDRARKRGALKRGEGARVDLELDRLVVSLEESSGDLIALDDALVALESRSPELARVVELRFFGGLSHASIAALLGTSQRTIERQWRAARAWLYARMSERRGGDG